MNKFFRDLCTPARIYLVLSVLACIVALFNGVSILSVFLKLVIALVWTYILGWLCNKGLTGVSWFLVLLPFIIILLAFIGVLDMMKKQAKQMQQPSSGSSSSSSSSSSQQQQQKQQQN